MIRGRIPCLAVAVLLAGACHLDDAGLGPGRMVDGSATRDAQTTDALTPDAPSCPEMAPPVDLLFVVDNSATMAEEQTAFAGAMGELVRALISGDLDADGTPDQLRAQDLHVGIVSTDMGTFGFVLPGCTDATDGDDGVLLETRTSHACPTAAPAIHAFGAGDTPADFVSELGCAVRIGAAGCGLEQPLEAALEALTPSTSSIEFAAMSRGHGDGANAGFLRPDSILAIVFLTDEDDCSAADPRLFDPSSTMYPLELAVRCYAYPAALQPVSRYSEGLIALVSSPDRLVVATISGVPTALVGMSPAGILAAPDMEHRLEGTAMRPSCTDPVRGAAVPPRRMVRLASSLEGTGARLEIQSICQDDLSPALRAVAARIGQAAAGPGCALP